MGRSRPALLVLGAVACGLAVIGLFTIKSLVRSSNRNGTLSVSDFDLTPLAIEETDRIGGESADIGKSFYVVRIRLADRSPTSNFHFDPHQMLLHSLDHGKVVRSARGQRALGSDGVEDLSPGSDEAERIAFMGEHGIRRMSVRFNLLGGPGELLGALFGPSPKLELPVAPLQPK